MIILAMMLVATFLFGLICGIELGVRSVQRECEARTNRELARLSRQWANTWKGIDEYHEIRAEPEIERAPTTRERIRHNHWGDEGCEIPLERDPTQERRA